MISGSLNNLSVEHTGEQVLDSVAGLPSVVGSWVQM
jgi:hypothetical protein